MTPREQAIVSLVFGLAGAALIVSGFGLVAGICRKLAKNYPQQYPTILRIMAVIAYVLGFTTIAFVMFCGMGHIRDFRL